MRRRRPAPRSRRGCARNAASTSSPSWTGRPNHDPRPRPPRPPRAPRLGRRRFGAGARTALLHRGAARGPRRAAQGAHARPAGGAGGGGAHHARRRLRAALGPPVGRLRARRVARRRRERRPAHRIGPPRRTRLGPRRRRRGALLAQARPGARPRHRRNPRRAGAERRDQRQPDQVSAMSRSRNAQRGLALILLLVVVVLALTYALMSRLPLATHQTAAKLEYNAKVLNQAKQALIGWMVINAAQTDNNPGRLPCPEGANNVGTNSEGVAAPDPGDPT